MKVEKFEGFSERLHSRKINMWFEETVLVKQPVVWKFFVDMEMCNFICTCAENLTLYILVQTTTVSKPNFVHAFVL